MDTGTRDIVFLPKGEFVENFTYDKWQNMIANQSLDATQVMTAEPVEENNNNNNNEGEN
jgi:hypothetical protein